MCFFILIGKCANNLNNTYFLLIRTYTICRILKEGIVKEMVIASEDLDIKDHAIRRIGSEDLNGLIKWYKQGLNSDAFYVVYVVRRSYILAGLLGRIIGESMRDRSEKLYLTDGSVLSCCEEIAAYYKENERFPKILLCDDILIHGRNLNRVIENIEARLIELLSAEVDKQTVIDALSDAIQIRVYCFAETGHVLLKYRYMKDAKFIVKQSPEKWRELSGKISSFITEVGAANATYINSEIIDQAEAEEIVKDGFDRFRFQCVEGYTKIKFLKNTNNDVFAIYTIRLLKNKINENYRVIPFLFMPNLDENETRFLFDKIKANGLAKGHSESFFEKLDYLNHVDGKRMFNEWISLILSNTVLQEFNAKYHIKREKQRDDDLKFDFEKLARNYRFDKTDTHETFLRNCIDKIPIFSDTKELESILLECGKKRPIFHIGEEEINLKKQFDNLEDYFYNCGVYEEQDAIIYNGSLDMQRGATHQMVKNCFAVFRRLLDQKKEEIARDSVSYFLLMMDAGVLSLSSHPARDLKVVGYAQFAKAGEQSMLIKPLRYMRIIPILSVAYDFCKGFSLDYYSYLKEFMNSGYCSFADEMDGFIEFARGLEPLEQNVPMWNGNYVEKSFENGKYEKDNKPKELYEEYKKYGECREKYLKEYMDFFDHRNH